MEAGLNLTNESCIVSAIHGLGHWVFYEPGAARLLQTWLQRPTTQHPAILDYARQATTGCVL
jgi:hypothetical protein